MNNIIPILDPMKYDHFLKMLDIVNRELAKLNAILDEAFKEVESSDDT